MRLTEPAVARLVPPFAARALPVFALAALALAPATLAAQEVTDVPPAFASVDWPTSGERLRELARRQDIEIGFASRSRWPHLPALEAEAYGAIAAGEFGMLTPEAAFKWEYLRPSPDEYDFAELDEQTAFAEANGMVLHGHPLIWYLLNPMWVETLPPEELPGVLEDHVRTVMTRYRGRYAVWDVINEALNHEGTALRDDFWTEGFGGTSYMDLAFRTARAADPDATLLYNEYDIGWLTEKSARALALVDELLARDVPIDGIGMQMHLENPFPHFEGFSEAMQRFADRGLDVYVTELDVAIMGGGERGEQSGIYEEVIRRCLMQPACRAVQIWGINDLYSWRPWFAPLPFDDDFRVKPAYFGMQRALMTRPVHPEHCALDGARIESGAVHADALDGGAGDAFALSCEGVRLEGGFTSLAVRYRNPGTDTPLLDVRAGDTLLASVPLAPTLASDDGDYRTVTVAVPPLDATVDLELVVGSASDGASVGVDALLFGDPTLALPPLDAPTPVGTRSDGGGGFGAAAPLSLALLAFATLASGVRRSLPTARRRSGVR